MQSPSIDREIVLPSAALRALRDAMEAESGPGATLVAFRDAGRRAAGPLVAGLEGDDEVSEAAFWMRLATFLARRGWGTFRHESPHPGVGVLRGEGWSANPEDGAPFTEGVLAGVLSGVAGAEVRVLRVRGTDDGVTFAFGGPAAIDALEQRIAAGDELDAALAGL